MTKTAVYVLLLVGTLAAQEPSKPAETRPVNRTDDAAALRAENAALRRYIEDLDAWHRKNEMTLAQAYNACLGPIPQLPQPPKELVPPKQ